MMGMIKVLKLAGRRVPARARIAIGQVFLMVAVLLFAISIGLFPDERRAEMNGRSVLCQAVAVDCAAWAQRNELRTISTTLKPALSRDANVLSAVVRRGDGSVVAGFGNFSAPQAADVVSVPIWSGSRKWATLEVRFRSVRPSGLLGAAAEPEFRVVAFAAVACLALYLLYLRRMLGRLDPSQVVPLRVRAALDTLAEGLMLLDAEGRIVLANQALADIVGKPANDLMGIRVWHLPWEHCDDNPAPWDAVAGSGGVRGIIMRLRDSQSNLRTFSVNCCPIPGEDGPSRGVLVSLDDVTRLQRNDAELRKSKEEADAANRAKSDFLARMSHEIRTPMNAILGFADILRRGYAQNDAERHEYIETIHSSGLHLLELINDILDLSKIEAGKLQIEKCRCSPARIIAEVISVMSVRAAQKGINLAARWDTPVPETIETDPTRLRQAMMNLVGNAIKFTEAGTVDVWARLDPAGPRPRLIIDVADSGIGMTPSVLARIFDPFAQGDTSITRRFGGTGLGLSISRQIAESLGGGVSVVSEVGRGSTFTLTVDTGPLDGVNLLGPQRVARESFAAEHRVTDPTIRLDGLRVLLGEDGVSNRKLVSLVLGRAGAIVDCAEDGQAAVKMAAGAQYDLIFLDMQMPVMDGYTAASKLREQGVSVPIVALTAHAMRGDEEKCRAAGCSSFLSKPIEMNLLLRTVAELTHSTPSKCVERPAKIESSLPMEDPEFRQIVDEFIERLCVQMRSLNAAWSGGDMDELTRVAHWIKGSGGTAGFAALTEPARLLEEAAREKRLDTIAAAVKQLQDLTDRIANTPGFRSTSGRKEPMTAGLAA